MSHRSRPAGWPGAGALLLLLGSTAAIAAGPSRVEDSAADAVYDCRMPPPDGFEARVADLASAVWDKNSLGCAADLMAAAASEAPTDVGLQVQALLQATAYIAHVNLLQDFDLYGIRVPEWQARLVHAIDNGNAIDARLASTGSDDPDLLSARALYKLTWPAKTADAKTAIVETRAAQALLEKAVAADPKALGGNAIWILARTYYDLPEFAGGDAVRAMKLLEQARVQTPGNIPMLRYSAYVHAQERNPALARTRLKEIVAAEPDSADLQTTADELKNARDLATRLQDTALADRLTAKRDALLAAHPQLLARKPTAANMHGGVDPITGKEY
jgi:tetratricopeptide (TPR) repeat protein